MQVSYLSALDLWEKDKKEKVLEQIGLKEKIVFEEKLVEIKTVNNKRPRADELKTKETNKKAHLWHTIEHIQLRNSENVLDVWFNVWWLGHKRYTTVKFDQLVEDGVDAQLLQKVMKKGPSAKKTTLVGLSLRSGREINPTISSLSGVESGTSVTDVKVDFSTDVKLRFKAQNSRCVPYSFLNVMLQSKKNKDMLIKKVGNFCSLAELSNGVTSVFGTGLSKPLDNDIPWLLEQTTGKFLVVHKLHCVGVDCDKQLIFDCGYPTALKLCVEALVDCGIQSAVEMRKID
jgi:hypothetical protein